MGRRRCKGGHEDAGVLVLPEASRWTLCFYVLNVNLQDQNSSLSLDIGLFPTMLSRNATSICQHPGAKYCQLRPIKRPGSRCKVHWGD